ncbi:MAG: cell division protein SepF [Dethiobacteria bacterium]|jgi:cell division inhibitor SepF
MNFWEKILRFFGLLEEEVPRLYDSGRRNLQKGKIVAFPSPETSYRMIVSRPAGFAEVEEIGSHLQNKRPVVVNLEDMELEEAKRTIDFLSGVIFALNGSSQKVNPHIFIFVPFGVALDFDSQQSFGERGLLFGDKKQYLNEDEHFKE